MSKKHNTRHRRGRSHYPDRLKARGVKASPMSDFRLDDGKMASQSR